MAKEYVYIQSTKSIRVTAGLQYENYTNPKELTPDRLKVGSVWNKMAILIKAGKHVYPSLICDWPTVKALSEQGVFTIGAYVDNPDDPEIVEKAKDIKAEIEKQKKVKDISLEDAAK